MPQLHGCWPFASQEPLEDASLAAFAFEQAKALRTLHFEVVPMEVERPDDALSARSDLVGRPSVGESIRRHENGHCESAAPKPLDVVTTNELVAAQRVRWVDVSDDEDVLLR